MTSQATSDCSKYLAQAAGAKLLLALAALAFLPASARPSHAQVLQANNNISSVRPAAAKDVSSLPAAPSATESALNVNPFSQSGLALSADSPNTQGNSLTSNPAPVKSGHHVVGLVGSIAGTVVAGFGTMLLVADSGCRGACNAKHLGEITLPIGAGVAALGYYYFFHRSN